MNEASLRASFFFSRFVKKIMKSNSPIIRIIPNFITSLNLLMGCLAIVAIFDMSLITLAPYLIFLAAFFDLLDGLAARTLGTYSPIGKDLDSLADVVSFGVAPSIFIFQIMHLQLNHEDPLFGLSHPGPIEFILLLCCFLPAIFGALRLARFNIDDSQKYVFKGLPIPANALFFSCYALLLFHTQSASLRNLLLNPYLIVALAVLFSYLMVSKFSMLSFKFKNLSLKENAERYFLVLLTICLLVFMGWLGLALVIPAYVLTSIFSQILRPSSVK
jgi:CDP-diacylglycerol---serine O-phosphatidyltransferase